jgi:manganese-dependent inorganic pyrophosphatase
MQTIVIGHKNPDMDSICSAIAYAELKRKLGVPTYSQREPGTLMNGSTWSCKNLACQLPNL